LNENFCRRGVAVGEFLLFNELNFFMPACQLRGSFMSYEHKAFIFDVEGFDLELKPLLEHCLRS